MDIAEREQQDATIGIIGCYWYNQYKQERDEWTFGNARMPTLRRFMQELGWRDIYDAIDLAHSMIPVWNDNDTRTYRYFCGICWNKIKAKKHE